MKHPQRRRRRLAIGVIIAMALAGTLVAASPAQAANPCISRLVNYYHLEMKYYASQDLWTTTIALTVPYNGTGCRDISVKHGAVVGGSSSMCPLYRVRATKSSGGFDYGDWYSRCYGSGYLPIYTSVIDGTRYVIQIRNVGPAEFHNNRTWFYVRH